MSFSETDREDERTLLEKVEKLQTIFVCFATQPRDARPDGDFERLRQDVVTSVPSSVLPELVRKYRKQDQFWQFIKYKFQHYAERREFIWGQFRPLIDYLESDAKAPGVAPITDILETFDPDQVHALWQKALDRRTTDPEGAITAARALLETVCKHILDEPGGPPFPPDADLPKLWGLAAERLHLAPKQHHEEVFRAILGNCQAVVNNLATIRNRIGDAHGQGRNPVKPKPRHAELAVNLAGTMASFLVATWQERQEP
jgi:hypothetical protein